jgi:transposase
VHRSNAVKQFAESTGGRLRLCFLPGYSPELNPDEWVWKHVRHDRIGRAGITGPEDLKAKALAALHRLQKLPHLVQSFFRDPSLLLHHCLNSPLTYIRLDNWPHRAARFRCQCGPWW